MAVGVRAADRPSTTSTRELYLVDRGVADLEHLAGDRDQRRRCLSRLARLRRSLCRSLRGREWARRRAVDRLGRRDRLRASASCFSAAGRSIQVGAMLGTIMVANVLFVIIPAHWELVRAKEAGPRARPGARLRGQAALGAQQLPDAAGAAGDGLDPLPDGHQPRPRLDRPGCADGGRRLGPPLLQPPARRANGLGDPRERGCTRRRGGRPREPDEPDTPASGQPVSIAQVQAIVAERCAECHSASPTNPSYSSAPAGVVLDTPEQIVAAAAAIEEQAVLSRAMPLGNVTGMTDEERGQLAAWIGAGAPGE